MSEDKDLLEYDDDAAVKFIKNHLPQELKSKFSNDEINYVIDIVYEFYESKGVLDEPTDGAETIEFGEDELISFVQKSIRKDKVCDFTEDEISYIIQGELAYCDSLGLFEE